MRCKSIAFFGIMQYLCKKNDSNEENNWYWQRIGRRFGADE
jgi:hypothetical protein